MKMDSNMKAMNEALRSAVINAFDDKEKEQAQKQRKEDAITLNKNLSLQAKMLKTNKDLFTKEECESFSKSIAMSQGMVVAMNNTLKEKINPSETCQKGAIDYINASKKVSSEFGDIAFDVMSHDKESTVHLHKYIQEAKDKGFYCELIHSKKWSNDMVDRRESYLMHNEAMSHVLNRIYNNKTNDDARLSETAFFLHFDPRVEKQFFDLDQEKKVAHFKKEAQEKDDAGNYFGMGRTIAGQTIGGRELSVNHAPEIQLQECLTNYFKDLIEGPHYLNKTVNVPTALTQKGEALSIKELSKMDIEDFYTADKPKQKSRKNMKP